MTAKEFVDRFLEVQREHGSRQPLLPATMIDAWRDFVDECTRGYGWNIYEYDNDLGIRAALERALRDEGLAEMPELAWVRRDVEEIDQRFRGLLSHVRLPHRTHWWELHPPRAAGVELASDFKAQHGIDLDVVET